MAFESSGAGLREALFTLALLVARVAPVFLLAPFLLFKARPSGWVFALSIAVALALLPCALVARPPSAAFDRRLLLSCCRELLRGCVLALGCGLPLAVFTLSGSLADGLRGTVADTNPALDPAEHGHGLGRFYAWAALLLLLGSSAHFGPLRLFSETLRELPLGSAFTSKVDARGALLEAGQWLLRAFELGVLFTAPLLLASLTIALLVGLWARASAVISVSPVVVPLWPFMGLAAVCLSAAVVLEQVPVVLRSFLVETKRLLRAFY